MTAKKKKSRSKASKKENNKLSGQEQFDVLHTIAFWGLALLLFFPPYFRGLFFAPEQEKALIFATLVFWLTFLWRWLQNDHKFLRGPLDYFALALPVVYIISSFTAVNKGLAIDEVVKNILYFLTYWSTSRLIRNEEDIHKLLHVIYISAIGVALAGLATATEIVYIPEGFSESRGGLISSTFQYHNALASYLGAVFFIGIYFWHRSNDNQKHAISNALPNETIKVKLDHINPVGYLYACGNFLLLAVLLGTKSRAGLLVFGLVFIIYLVGIRNERRITSLLIISYLSTISYIIIVKFIYFAIAGQHGTAWLWLIGGILTALAAQHAINLLNRHVFTRWTGDYKKIMQAFMAVIVIFIIAGGIWVNGKPHILEKITSMEYLNSAYQRYYYIGSALEMIEERPLLGWGGGGWREAYEAFLGYRFTTHEVHSYYFQIGVETGILGVIIVSCMWLSFLILSKRSLNENNSTQKRKSLIWLFIITFFIISGHALIDFDLSLSALAIVLWSILGMTFGLLFNTSKSQAHVRTKQDSINYTSVTMATIIMLCIALLSASLLHASNLAKQGMYHLRVSNVAMGVECLEKAVAYNPFNAEYRIALSQVYSGLGKINKAMTEAWEAVDLSKYRFSTRNNFIKIAMFNNENERAAHELENILSLAPNILEVYEEYARHYVTLGVMELKSGNEDDARKYLERACQVTHKIEQRTKNLKEEDTKIWQGRKLYVNHNIQLAVGQANYCLGNYKEAEEYLMQVFQARDKETRAQAMVWMALIKDKKNNPREKEKLLDKAKKLAPEIVKGYSELKIIKTLED